MEAVSHASASRQRKSPPSAASISDELLARRAGGGSRRAFESIYARHHQALYSYCRSIVRDESDAEDALQETFTKALSALQRGQRNAPLKPWLFRIAHNEAISLIRRRSRATSVELDESQLPSVGSAADEAAQRGRWAQLMADLIELPERPRSALLLRELSGLSHEEIAIALETTTGAAKQSILDARRALAEFAEGRTMDCDQVCRQISAGDRRTLRARRIRAHLRDCSGCRAFADGIEQRQADLRAFVPVLAPVAAATLLANVLHGGAGTAAGALGSASATISAGRVGLLSKAAGAAASAKTVTAAAVVVVAATAGTAGLTHVLSSSHPVRSQTAPSRTTTRNGAAPAAHRSAATAAHQAAASSRPGVAGGASARDGGRHLHLGRTGHGPRTASGANAGRGYGKTTRGHGCCHGRALGRGHGQSGVHGGAGNAPTGHRGHGTHNAGTARTKAGGRNASGSNHATSGHHTAGGHTSGGHHKAGSRSHAPSGTHNTRQHAAGKQTQASGHHGSAGGH